MFSMQDAMEGFKKAVAEGDGQAVRRILEQHSYIKDRIDEPVLYFDSPAIVVAAGRGHRDTIDALLAAGADVNARSRWWAGSFGVLDSAKPELAAYLIERGAKVDIHSAARLGLLDEIKAFVYADPSLVHARGGDGQTPLHFASNVEIAKYLLDHGAEIDARDIDHESTAAQYMVRERQEIVRYLIERGCQTDILMASAIGDIALVRKHLEVNPDCIRTRVNENYFPKQNPRSGGTIYTWTLGKNRSPHQVASKFGHREIVRLLTDHTPSDLRLVNACLLGNETEARELLARNPGLAPISDRGAIAAAAEDNDAETVRLMLDLGWPVDGDITPLHWAAWHGNAEMARAILAHNPPLEAASRATFDATPLGWAIHGSEHGWHSKTGDYSAVVEALLDAGAKPPEKIAGTEPVRSILTARRPRRP